MAWKMAAIIAIFVSAWSCVIACGAPQELSPDLLAHLGHQAAPLRSTDPGTDDADLQPLIPLLRGRSIVAMGEATHGTREFFQLKHRFFAFMVQRLGFRTFALEARAQDVEPANAYAQRGAGSAEAAVRALAEWPWETREVVALLEWARRYNASVPENVRVQFRGIDFQGPGRDAHMAENLKALAEHGAPGGLFLREAWITRDEAWPSLYDAIVFVRHTTATRPLQAARNGGQPRDVDSER
jgi:erythromycin esterase